ncbi:hypothetical protein MJO29_010824, partial [Puccinia striiformis f. sp. tritici]
AAALGANRVYSLCTQIMVQSRSNPVNHEQDQIGCKIKLLSRQNTRANQTLGQILASRRGHYIVCPLVYKIWFNIYPFLNLHLPNSLLKIKVTRVICDQVIPCQFWAFDVTRVKTIDLKNRPLRSKSGTDSKISIPKTVTAALFVSEYIDQESLLLLMTKYKRTVKVDRPAIFPHEGNRSEL